MSLLRRAAAKSYGGTLPGMTSDTRRRALRMLDDAIARMGSDPGICSFDGVIDEIADRKIGRAHV